MIPFVSLLHMDGADASTTFTDVKGKVWTANGNAQIDTAQSVFGGASGLFDGTGDWIESADHADWQLDGGADANLWTAGGRVRFNGDPGTGTVPFFQQWVDVNNFWSISLINNLFNILIRSASTNIVNLDFAWNPATATWYHWEMVKNGTSGYMVFVDGTQVGATQTDSSPMPDLAGVLRFGKRTSAAGADTFLNGWADETYLVKGAALHTANFTPPTQPYSLGGGAVAMFF